MAITTSYPGVYIEELPGGVRPIEGVATSITAFLGCTLRGATGAPGTAKSWAEFERLYGGLWKASALGYAVQHFFNNGGGEALIVRVHNGATVAKATVPAGGLALIAASEGAWGNGLRARVEASDRSKPFDLSVKDLATGTIEVFQKLSIDPADPRFVAAILAQESQLVRFDGTAPASVPPASAAPDAGGDVFTDPTATRFAGGGDGADITDAQIPDGLRMLDRADLFNMLCIPPLKRSGGDVGKPSWNAAIAYAKSRRAFVIVDPAEHWTTVNDVLDAGTGVTSVVAAEDNAAMYFPRIVAPDPLNDGQPDSFAPCGAIAGIFARTDAPARRLEGTGRNRSRPAQHNEPVPHAQRRRKRTIEFRRYQLPPHLSRDGKSCVGRTHPAESGYAGLAMEVHSGPPACFPYPGEHLSRHEMGRVRAECGAAVGGPETLCRLFHAYAVHARRPSGPVGAAGVLRAVRTRHHGAVRHRSRRRQRRGRLRAGQAG